MIACFDVHYNDEFACAATVVFKEWTDTKALLEYSQITKGHQHYQAGEFYCRELEPLLNIIATIKEPIKNYVVDAYCHLSKEHKKGLGAYLYQALNQQTPVIGVAKNRFKDSIHAVELLRGQSKKPLYITSVGMPYEEAALNIASMAGKFRIPTLLKQVDQNARAGLKTKIH